MEKLKISEMTGKLSGIPAINTSPKDNPFCIRMNAGGCEVCQHCYSHVMLDGHRRNCRPAWARNGQILSAGPLDFKQIPKFQPGSIVRFNGHGELVNGQHMGNILAICRNNPESTFTLWTKRIGLVQAAIRKYGKPENLILIRSSKSLNKAAKLPRYFDKVFTVYSKDQDVKINCGAKSCATCRLCYTHNEIVHVKEILK